MPKRMKEILKYDTFNFNSFNISYNDNNVCIAFEYEIVGLKKFIHKLELPYTNKQVNKAFVEKLCFNIGLLELVNYWKATISKNVFIKCGKINEEQEAFFKKIYFYGLGEFFYVNHLDVDYDNFMNIKSEGKVYDTEISYQGSGRMIGIGGGKDSCVTLELLKNEKDNSCFIINPKKVNLACALVSGYDDSNIYKIKRVLDKELLKLNDDGFLNGHTPFSAMVSFVSFLLAYLNNKKDIVLSNESSANQVNVVGTKINHQYSKSYEYEVDFKNYANKYLCKGINYFSFLRPLLEYQIGMIFANRCTKYHKLFKSCNVGSKGEEWIWCCHCAKCLFVYALLSPHLYKDKLVNIFGEDMYENKELLTMFLELLGKVNVKPFDCVGTFEEINYAITKTIDKYEGKLPYLLEYYKNNYYDEKILNYNLETQYEIENNLDSYYEKIIRDAIEYDE